MTAPKFHFISGLPRAGTTLLAALLKQNPRFDASMTSGLGSLVSGAMQIMSPGSEVALTLKDGQREDILRSLFSAYYQRTADREVIFDTNRIWTARMPLLAGLFPQAKVIACVRDVSWVMDSLERRVRANPYHFTRLFGPNNQGTVYSRVESLMHNESLVGRAWSGLKEAFYGEQAASLLVIDYELLSRAPVKVLPLVYQFLGEPWFEGHDFDNVLFDAPEFDEALGIDGLHRVRPKVEFQARPTILPPDLFKKFQGMDFCRDLAGTRAHVIAPQAKAADGAPDSATAANPTSAKAKTKAKAKSIGKTNSNA
jgi:sulfotransferase